MLMFYNILSKLSEQAASWRGNVLVQLLTRGFFEKKQFRAYREFTAATVIKFVAAKPFLLQSQILYCDAGNARVVVYQGGTEGGVFTPLASKFGKYLLDGPVVGNTTLTVGGTITGGTEREVIRAASGAGVGIVNSLTGTRALPAGTYYISIGVTGTTSGVYSIEWEELDPL